MASITSDLILLSTVSPAWRPYLTDASTDPLQIPTSSLSIFKRKMHSPLLLTVVFFVASEWLHLTTALRNINLRDATLRDLRRCTDERFYKMEMILAKIMSFGPNGRPFPENPEQLETYCSEGRDMINQVENFLRECVKRRIADVTVVIMYSIKGSFYKKYCGAGKKAKKESAQLMAMAPCVNRYLLPDDRCIMQFVNETKDLVNLADDELKVPHTCCNYVKTVQCLSQQLDEQPCLQQYREPILDIVRSVFSNIADIMCDEFNEFTDRCAKLGPPPAPLLPNLKPYKTFMWVLTDVLASMKSLLPAKFRNGSVPESEFINDAEDR